MAKKAGKKSKVEIKDLPERSVPSKKADAVKGGLYSGGLITRDVKGTTTPRNDRWTTDDGSDVD